MKDKQFLVPEKLIAQNPHTMILSLASSRFKKYGRVLHSLDVTELLRKAEALTPIPEDGNLYVPSLEALESCSEVNQFGPYFGNLPIQVGFCNGKNQTMNGMEYHKSPELFIAVTDCVQFLCSYDHLENFNTVQTKESELFFFPKGSVTLIDSNVLHLAPCMTESRGFKSIIVLPKDTNEPLESEEVKAREASSDPEARLLLKKNKWILAHPERLQLVSQQVHVGLVGENRRVIPQ